MPKRMMIAGISLVHSKLYQWYAHLKEKGGVDNEILLVNKYHYVKGGSETYYSVLPTFSQSSVTK